MVSGHLFHCRKNSWPPEEYVARTTLQLLDLDGGSPPEQAWRRRLNSHANILKEFSVTFMEAMKMMTLGVRLWSYVREEASYGRKAPIDPFTRERCKPSASQGVPLGGMGSGSISRGFRGEFKNWHIIPGLCENSPVMENQFSIFVTRDGGNKKYSSVLAPGHHEGLKGLERSSTLLADVITVVVKGGHSGWVAIQSSYNIIRWRELEKMFLMVHAPSFGYSLCSHATAPSAPRMI